MAAPEKFDAVIVGAGISGSLIAKQLGLKGKKVLILEAGPENPPNINDYMHRFYKALAKVPEIPYPPEIFTPPGSFNFTDPGTWNAGRPTVLTLGANNWQDPKQAYLIQKGPLVFASTYDRVGGGTTRHWLGTSLRFVPNDFKMKTVYNREIDWPFGYDTLEPWYGKAEWEIGVSADKSEQDYLGITFGQNYNYPMPGIPESMVDDVSSGVNGLSIDKIALSVSPTPQGRIRALSGPARVRRQHQLHPDLSHSGEIRRKRHAERRAADRQRAGSLQERRQRRHRRRERACQPDQLHHVSDGKRPAHRHRQRHRQGIRHGGTRDRDAEAPADVEERRPHGGRLANKSSGLLGKNLWTTRCILPGR